MKYNGTLFKHQTTQPSGEIDLYSMVFMSKGHH